MKTVYLDYASTTPVDEAVLEEMMPYLHSHYGNPSSLYEIGIHNRKIINTCRRRIASYLNVKSKEIYFCSGGSEANNWALKGMAFRSDGRHEIITTQIEHHSVTHACQFLERMGFQVHYLGVDREGFVDLEELKSKINENTLLVSIILANNEIGTIQQIETISSICHEHGVLVHTDAVQAVGHLPIDIQKLGVDLLSFSSHKLYGPKGSGVLYIKEGTQIENLIHGGNQEQTKRSGTENVAQIVGMTKALEVCIQELNTTMQNERSLSERLLSNLQQAIPSIRLNGPSIGNTRLPGNVNVSFHQQDGANLCFELNKQGIYASTGSACNAGMIEPSHVLQAIGVDDDYIDGTIRLTIGKTTTKDEIDYVSHVLIDLITK